MVKRRIFQIVLLLVLMCLSGSVVHAESDPITFTDEEKQFIKEHPVIHIGVDPTFIPYEFIDTDGEYKGIAADYIRLISERTGLIFDVEKDNTWDQAYEKAVTKKLDVLPCISRTTERENYFLFSKPYYDFQRVIVVKESNTSIVDFESLHGTRVAVQKNSSHHSFIKEYPDIRPDLYDTVVEGLEAVASGKETVFIGNLATSSYLIREHGLTGLKFIQISSEDESSLYFAVRKDYPELVSIINKGLDSITTEEKLEINNHWISFGSNSDFGKYMRILIVVASVIAIVLGVSFYWIIKLRKEVEIRVKAEQELLKAKAEAEVANSIKSSFLARMSHEIRTPLNAIIGISYLLKKTEINLTQKIYVDKVIQASNNMLGIINDILDFSKIESGKIEIERVSFQLDNLIQNVVSIVEFKIQEQEIGFQLQKEPNIPDHFWGDSRRIEQILLNLINNAVKFTPEGDVTLKVRLLERVDSSMMLEFAISDTGVGMTQEQINQLFTPFAQGDSSINRRFGGTGLGLSIVKSFVELMGGGLRVESSPGKGSTFYVTLLLEVDQEKEFEEKRKVISLYVQDIRAMVLEKNKDTLQTIGEYLNYMGLKADQFLTEEEALAAIARRAEEKKPYDLMVVDFETPKDGGIAFAKRIAKRDLSVHKSKVILMTPLMRGDLFEKIEKTSDVLGVTKPIIPSVLYNGILEIFKIHALESEEADAFLDVDLPEETDETYRVLVVEDNKTNQFIAKTILEQAGMEVTIADNGEIAVRFYQEHQSEIDIILMDLHMPVLNGYEATQQIREFDQEIPIVALTADAIAGVEEECKRAGINYYISKPFDPSKFVGTIVGILKKNQKTTVEEVCEPEHEKGEETPVLDERDGISRLGNNKELYRLVLAEYYEENKDVADKVRAAVSAKNYEEARQLVHKNKGGSGNIGAKKLHAAAAELQAALLSKDDEKKIELLMEFEEQLGAVLHAIERYQ